MAALALFGCSEPTPVVDPVLEALKRMDEVGDPSSVQTRNVKAPGAAGITCGEVKFVATGNHGWTGWMKFSVHKGGARINHWTVETVCPL